MMRRAAIAAMVALALGLGACGGEDGGDSLATARPEEVLERVEKALLDAPALHVDARGRSGDNRMRLLGDVLRDGQFQITLTQGAARTEMISTRGTVYMKGNRATWTEQGLPAGTASAIAGRWLRVPKDAEGQDDPAKAFLPSTLAHCLLTSHGELRNLGVRSVDGRDVVVIDDAGGKPGLSPGRYYVPATGPALPLRGEQTGPQAPGTSGDPLCEGDGDADMFVEEITISALGEDAAIRAPANALDLAAASGERS